MATSKTLKLDQITIDGGTQSRAAISTSVVEEYSASIDALPPVVVFSDGAEYWLADGFHRYHAAALAGRATIAADVRRGTLRDAVLFAVGANATHGLRRKNADKRKAVEMVLADPTWAKRSDRWVAERCGVDNETVGRVRAQLAENANSGSATEYRESQDGKQYPVKPKAPRPPAQPATPPEADLVARYWELQRQANRLWADPSNARLMPFFAAGGLMAALELGLERPYTVDRAKEIYRERVKIAHPDRGGDVQTFRRLTWAWEVFKGYCPE